MLSLDVVIVNWNSGLQLNECIESIYKATKTNFRLNKIIIVDNASNDDSLNIVNSNRDNLFIIKNDKNMGFGKACNQGAKQANGDFLLFLNPDMLIFEDTFLNLFEYIEKNNINNIAIYGIQLLDEDNNIQRNCARLPKLSTFIIRTLGLNKLNPNVFQSYTMEDWDHSVTKIVDQVMGAFFMVKRDVFDELGGFDERFFVYYEELDFSKRAKDSKYETLFVSESQAYHKAGGTSEKVKAKRLFYNTRSRMIYAFKHFSLLKGVFLFFFTLIIEPITRMFFLLLKGKYSEIIENFKGFRMLYMDGFNIIKHGLKK